MYRVVITGPTGAIGIALIENLIKRDISVVAVCHCNSKRINRIPKSDRVSIVECDLENIKSLPDLVSGKCDVFYHFAWACTFGDSRNNIDAQMKNIQYTLEAVEVAKKLGCNKFIGAGSQAEYGRFEGVLNSTTPTYPENGYGIAKLCAGQMSRIRCAQLGIEHIWTRILSIYGPYDGEKTMIMSVINQLLLGQKPSCTKGEQIWDYLYSKDAAQAFYLLGERGVSGKTYCLGSGKGKKLSNYITTIRDAIDSNMMIGFGDIPYSEKQVMHLCADISDLEKDTGFSPKYSFETGVSETIKWVKGVNEYEENKHYDTLL